MQLNKNPFLTNNLIPLHKNKKAGPLQSLEDTGVVLQG